MLEFHNSSCFFAKCWQFLKVEFHGLDGFGGPTYGGTGCFQRRDVLCGRKFTKDSKFEWKKDDHKRLRSILELEQETKSLASCTYEQNTQWGKEVYQQLISINFFMKFYSNRKNVGLQMGLRYGCLLEDVITGLSIHCRGWKSVYINPERKAFTGLAPTTLSQTLVQHKRWAEGAFQILFCNYSPLSYARGKISFGLQLGYCYYCFWCPSSIPVLCYCIFPSLYLLKGISLFPQVYIYVCVRSLISITNFITNL